MEFSQYKELFIGESEEIISSLNNNLVNLESNPSDLSLLQEIFRLIHTLKGMAATMGYQRMSTLAHALETLLDVLRRGVIEADKEIMDKLFQGVDKFSQIIEVIKKGEEESSVEIEDLIETLKDINVGDIKTGIKPTEAGGGFEERRVLRLDEEDRKMIKESLEKGEKTYQVTLAIERESLLKQARAFTALSVARDMGKIIKPHYIANQIKQGKFGRLVVFFLTSKHTPEEIRNKLVLVPEIEKVDVKILDINFLLPLKKEKETEKKETETPKASQTIRVKVNHLDNLMNLIGELVIDKTRLIEISRSLGDKALSDTISRLNNLISALQDEMIVLRLVPLAYIFSRFPRMMRDVAAREAKEIDFIIEGEDIDVDRTVLDEINEPLIHLLRNAVSHGVESPAVRKAKGKKERGTIRLKAAREKNYVVIEVSDDGGGINIDNLKKVAVEKGFFTQSEVEKMKDEDILNVIFLPGFSTKEKSSFVSGRGVGMDVVKDKVTALGGTVHIETEEERGTKVTIRLPVNMAIIEVLLVRVGKYIYCLPLVSIIEIIKISKNEVKKIDNTEVVNYRGTVLPIIRLEEKFGAVGRLLTSTLEEEKETVSYQDDGLSVVVAESAGKVAGLVVDKLIGQQDIVVKNLPSALRKIKGIGGATILGKGEVVLVLDLNSLIS